MVKIAVQKIEGKTNNLISPLSFSNACSEINPSSCASNLYTGLGCLSFFLLCLPVVN